MSDMKKGDMSMDREGIQSVVSQIEDTLSELTKCVSDFAQKADEEDQKLDGQSAPTHAIAAKLGGQVKQVRKLSEHMDQVKSFLSKYEAKGDDVNDISGFNTQED